MKNKDDAKKSLIFSVLIFATLVVIGYVTYLWYVVPPGDQINVDEVTNQVQLEDFLGSILEFGR